ncbi:hypothetical protein PCURB6_42500 [Paenibacillus curdlanolyticus]|nr:hypothetical protein PCURB6_42500 [Paenibacillus curdlanolyticus]
MLGISSTANKQIANRPFTDKKYILIDFQFKCPIALLIMSATSSRCMYRFSEHYQAGVTRPHTTLYVYRLFERKGYM